MYTGLSDTAQQVTSTVGGIAATVTPTVLTSTGAIAAGSLAVPIIGAAIAGVTTLVGIFLARNAQYHAQETAATKIVDQAEQLMKQNLDAWNSSEKTQSEQKQAIANYNNIWSQVVQACNRPELADPGQRCIHDRERGGPWPWPVYYLDPIQNDPNVKPDPNPVDAALNSITGGGQGMSFVPLLIGGLLLLAVAEL